MDLNGDGRRDIISGSYPGELYLFAGDGEGGFAKGEPIRNRENEILKVGRATVVFATDWEGDGDLDLIVGDIEGRALLVRNASGNRALEFGEATPLRVGEDEIRAPGRNSGPTIADWDGDGRSDLILGCGNGSVLLFRDTSKKGEPVLAEPVVLVGPAEGERGSRGKPAVADWNGDGKLDLLVGDFASAMSQPKALTEDDAKRRDELAARQAPILAKLRECSLRVQEQVRRDMGLDPGVLLPDLYAKMTPEQQADFRQRQGAAMQGDEEYQKLLVENREVSRELAKYRGSPKYHGYVWLFLRE